jgi:hypothetical protein
LHEPSALGVVAVVERGEGLDPIGAELAEVAPQFAPSAHQDGIAEEGERQRPYAPFCPGALLVQVDEMDLPLVPDGGAKKRKVHRRTCAGAKKGREQGCARKRVA